MEFSTLWNLETVRLADLPESSIRALGRPPLVALGPEVASRRREAIEAVPLEQLISLVATVGLTRPDDFMAALEIAGLIEAEPAEPSDRPDLPPPAGPPAPPPLTLPVAAAPPAPPALQLLPMPLLPPAGDTSSPWRICATCGKGFPPPSGSNYKRALYCSLSCKNAAKARFNREKRAARIASTPLIRCAACGTDFRPSKHNQKWCSERCGSRVRNRALTDRRRTERGLRTCEHCQAIYAPLMPGQRWCSPACATAARRAITAPPAAAPAPRTDRELLAHRREVDRWVLRFQAPGRHRWLLRQVVENGHAAVAAGGGISEALLRDVLARLRQLHGRHGGQ